MRVTVCCLVLSIMSALPGTPDAAPAYGERVVQINWGMRTRADQTWDGSASVSEGEVVSIPLQVYSQSEFGIYNQRESKTSWKMLCSPKYCSNTLDTLSFNGKSFSVSRFLTA